MNPQPFIDRRSLHFAPEAPRPATIVDVNEAPPQRVESDGSQTWIVRGANFVVVITRAVPGARLRREGQVDEYMLYLPPGRLVEVFVQGRSLAPDPDSLTIVPPGDSEIVVSSGGDVFMIFSNRSGDLAGSSFNAGVYSDGVAEVAPLVEWPEPVGGFQLRSYPLSDVRTGDAFGRIYRSTNLMVNVFEPYPSSRNQAALSPHSHTDFEQGSLTIDGRFEHYLRTPWGKDRAGWRDDVTARCGSPSITVIPAGMIHTTAWFGAQGRLIDIFAPPRADFSSHPGWVRNDDDYPAPSWISPS